MKKENECKIQTETDAASLSSSCVVEWDGVSCWPASLWLLSSSLLCSSAASGQFSPIFLCLLRKLLCARNYIHLNLFVSFMLRSLAVFIKDDVLFADESTDHCTVSTLRCQAAVTFFNFCVVSNFWWLLVEALYLQTLLLLVFTQTRKLLWIYAVIGWGAPTVTVVIWINFLIFLNISRIIVQKTKATHVNPSETHLYRLRRCTLLLIPLFGLHYVVFALFPDHVGVGPRLYLELVLGSFQGFIVAVLYCFLNGEVICFVKTNNKYKKSFIALQVQKEIQRLVRSCRPETNTNVVNLPTQEDVSLNPKKNN
uniref:Growth hormone releasing hormone receptor 2 n=1 Tax=Seriola lalandi dorsalis TaxID=1841481 RepID=A0A3B4WB98_SERLL